MIPVGAGVTNHKHEWIENVLLPTSATLTAMTTNGDGTVFSVASTAALKAGMIVCFEASTGATKAGLARISAVDANGTDFTIARSYGGATLATLAVGDILKLVSYPKNEGSEAVAGNGSEASVAFNYTEIFDFTVKVSRTAQQTGMYGVNDPFLQQIKDVAMPNIERKMNNALLKGYKKARTASVGEDGTAGGLLQFLTGGNVVAGGSAAITATKINDAFEKIFAAGGISSNYALVMSPNQSRKVSAFNTSGTNPLITAPLGTQTTGARIYEFVSDMAIANGFNAKVVVDPNMYKDMIYVVDLNAVEVCYMQTLKDMDATLPGGDYFARRLLAEATFCIKNGAQRHALINALTV